MAATTHTETAFAPRNAVPYADAAHLDATTFDATRVTLPLPPTLAEDERFEMEVYARFMRHLRLVPGSRMDVKILSSIQFTADMMDHGDALIARIMVDRGLRAPRRAFPVSFVDFVDKAMQRMAAGFGAPSAAILALKQHWDKIGEDRFSAGIQTQYALTRDSHALRV